MRKRKAVGKYTSRKNMTPEQVKEHHRTLGREWERANRVKYSCPKSRTDPTEKFKKNTGTFIIDFN